MIRRTFTNPTSGNEVIEAPGDYYVIEDMTDDDAANRTLIVPNDGGDSLGVPVINRTRVVFSKPFQYLTVQGNSGSAGGTVYILVGFEKEEKVYLPPA